MTLNRRERGLTGGSIRSRSSDPRRACGARSTSYRERAEHLLDALAARAGELFCLVQIPFELIERNSETKTHAADFDVVATIHSHGRLLPQVCKAECTEQVDGDAARDEVGGESI